MNYKFIACHIFNLPIEYNLTTLKINSDSSTTSLCTQCSETPSWDSLESNLISTNPILTLHHESKKDPEDARSISEISSDISEAFEDGPLSDSNDNQSDASISTCYSQISGQD